MVDFLREPSKYCLRLGARIPPRRAALLGPPWRTGKTLLARAVAGEANVPFFSMSASEFVEAIVGIGAARVRDLFVQAKAAAPSIIFIDELDAIGRSRTSGVAATSAAATTSASQTLNQILTEMDGFSSHQGVIVLAATNRPDVLDQALLRPGRFDRRVAVQPPDRMGREKILEVHTRSVPLGPDVDLGRIASTTPGMVGADLANLRERGGAACGSSRTRAGRGGRLHRRARARRARRRARQLMMSPEELRSGRRTTKAVTRLVGMLTEGADPVRKISDLFRAGLRSASLSPPP